MREQFQKKSTPSSGPGRPSTHRNEPTNGEANSQGSRTFLTCRDLRVYQNATDAAARIFEATIEFVSDERTTLAEPIRRTSQAVCTELAAAWYRRRNPPDFVAQLWEAGTAVEATRLHIEIGRRCQYFSEQHAAELNEVYDRIAAQIGKMLSAPERWAGGSNRSSREEES